MEPLFHTYRSDDPACRDPRYQRLVIAVKRPIPFVENMHEAKLECGHEPLLMGGPVPVVGGLCFCPDCYQGARPE